MGGGGRRGEEGGEVRQERLRRGIERVVRWSVCVLEDIAE